MVLTAPTHFKKNKMNSTLYKQLKKDYEAIIKDRTALHKLNDDYYNMTVKLNEELNKKDSQIEYWKNTTDDLVSRVKEIENELQVYKNKEKEWQGYSNDFCYELEETKKNLDKTTQDLIETKANLYNKTEECEKTSTDLYKKHEENISKDVYLSELKNELEYYKETVHNFPNVINEHNDEMERVKTERDNARIDSFHEINICDTKLKEKNLEIYDIQQKHDNEIGTMKNEYNTKIEEKEKEYENNYKRFGEIQQMYVEKYKDYSELEQKYDIIMKDFIEMDKFIQMQDKQLSDYKSNNTTLAKNLNQLKLESKIELDDMHYTIDRLREIIRKKKTKNDDLTVQILEMQTKYDCINNELDEFINAKKNEEDFYNITDEENEPEENEPEENEPEENANKKELNMLVRPVSDDSLEPNYYIIEEDDFE